MDLDLLDELVPLCDPAALPRVLTRAQAASLGIGPSALAHLLRTRRWCRVLPRVYLTAGTLTWTDRLDAALLFAGGRALLSGAAALGDLGLRSVARPRRILVLVPAGCRVRSCAWVQVRATARLPRPALLPGPRRVPVERAVADLALTTTRLDDVRMLVAEATRQRLCTVEELAAELRAGPRNGSALLREALEDAVGAWSVPEARAARLLRAAGLGGFEQNARVELPDGTHRVVDFLWRALRAVLEIDSDSHHALAGDADGTADRHLTLETAGFTVVHRTPRLIVREPARFTDGIGAWLRARAALIVDQPPLPTVPTSGSGS